MAVRIDPSLIPPADANNLAYAFLDLAMKLSEDPDFMREFEEWKARGEHKKYTA